MKLLILIKQRMLTQDYGNNEQIVCILFPSYRLLTKQIENFPAKKIMTLIEKKALDDSNVPSPYKASPGLKDKTSLEKETEVQRSNFGKEETKAKVNEQKNNKNVSAKSAASKKRKEQLQKSQKQQTLISKIIYSNNDLMKIDEILQQELMNNNDPSINFIHVIVYLTLIN